MKRFRWYKDTFVRYSLPRREKRLLAKASLLCTESLDYFAAQQQQTHPTGWRLEIQASLPSIHQEHYKAWWPNSRDSRPTSKCRLVLEGRHLAKTLLNVDWNVTEKLQNVISTHCFIRHRHFHHYKLHAQRIATGVHIVRHFFCAICYQYSSALNLEFKLLNCLHSFWRCFIMLLCLGRFALGKTVARPLLAWLLPLQGRPNVMLIACFVVLLCSFRSRWWARINTRQ